MNKQSIKWIFIAYIIAITIYCYVLWLAYLPISSIIARAVIITMVILLIGAIVILLKIGQEDES